MKTKSVYWLISDGYPVSVWLSKHTAQSSMKYLTKMHPDRNLKIRTQTVMDDGPHDPDLLYVVAKNFHSPIVSSWFCRSNARREAKKTGNEVIRIVINK